MDRNAAVPVKTAKETYNGSEYEMKLNPAGTVYSIICSAGVKEYQEIDPAKTDKYFARAESIVSNDYPMFSAITVDGTKLYYDAYQVKDGKAENWMERILIPLMLKIMQEQQKQINALMKGERR